jgi:hypothetical protein
MTLRIAWIRFLRVTVCEVETSDIQKGREREREMTAAEHCDRRDVPLLLKSKYSQRPANSCYHLFFGTYVCAWP